MEQKLAGNHSLFRINRKYSPQNLIINGPSKVEKNFITEIKSKIIKQHQLTSFDFEHSSCFLVFDFLFH